MAAAANRFSLLEDDDADDFTAAKYASATPSPLPAAAQKSAPKKPAQPLQSSAPAPAKLPSKPLPPAEAVRAERDSHFERGRGRGFGRRGRGGDSFAGRGGGGFRDSGEGEPHRSFEGGGRGRGRRGGFTRSFDGDDKRKEDEAPVLGEEEAKPGEGKEEAEQKKPEAPEDNEMTLDEYEKIMQEKRKNLGQHKLGERKVEADSELKKMQVMEKKSDSDVFIKLGSDKEKLKKKDSFEKDKKAMTINEFLKPAEGERFSPRGGRSGRGRGAFGGRFAAAAAAGGAQASDNGIQSPSNIDNPHEFPLLGKKK